MYQNKYKDEEMNKYKDGRKREVKGRKKERVGMTEFLMCATFISIHDQVLFCLICHIKNNGSFYNRK